MCATWRCLCCDDVVGNGSAGHCAALQLLETLGDELTEQDNIIAAAMAAGDADVESLHRGARKKMYRAYVAAKYGYLGQGNRVVVPMCVALAIRLRYYNPECNCTPDEVARPCVHYMGHKDA